jgi:hypothetical protein
MKYEIVSPRLGTVGDKFDPKPGVNVGALLDNGFIKESAQKPKNRAKIENKETEQTNGN